MNNIQQIDNIFVANTYARFPVTLTGGKGSVAFDIEGREYIDMGSGIAVNSFGIADGEWAKAVSEQLLNIQHSSNLYYTAPQALLAQELCTRTGMKKVFFSNSGAEANECAIKAARKYAAEKRDIANPLIVTLCGSFHGRTITTLAATGQEAFHKDFQPLTPGFVHVQPNDIEALEAAMKQKNVSALMLECVQGEGGVIALDEEYLSAAQELCKKTGVLLICDEVQCGNGRSGELYAYMHYGLKPDIVTTAKGLGGGLPIGAAMFAESTADVLAYGDHGSTFGGNPAVCAGALNIIKRIDDELLSSVKKKSEFIFELLDGAKGIEGVSGLGLMIGIKTEKNAGKIVEECLQNGVLVLKAKDKVRLLPALNIPFELLEKAIEIIKNAAA